MSKLFKLAQAKGKWHKFPSFNLEGGAKLYKNLAQKLLAVSLCMAVVLMGVPFSRDINVEAANAYSVVRLTVTEPYTDDYGNAVPLSMVSSWDSFVPGAPTRLVVEFVYDPSSDKDPVTRDVLDWFAKFGELPSAEPFVPEGWFSSSLGVAFHFGSRVDSAALLFKYRIDTAALTRGTAWSDTGYPWGASVPAFTLLVTKSDLQTVIVTSAALARVCVAVGASSAVSMDALFGSGSSAVSAVSSDPSVAAFDPDTSSISGLEPGSATLTFKDASGVAIGSVVVSVAASGHVWDEGTITTPATCTAPGEKTFTCQHGCGETKTEEVAALGHAWDDGKVTKAPTCTEAGVKTFTCKHNAEHTYEEEVAIDPDAHDWDEGTITTPATCTVPGVRTFTCQRTGCEETKTEEVAIDPEAHGWDDGKITKDPTCTEVGVKTYTCKRDDCGETRRETVDALGHDFVGGACSRCGAVDPDSPAPPTPGPNPDTPPADTPAESSYLEATVDVKGQPQRLRVYDPDAVLPSDTSFSAAYVDGSHGDHNFFVQHVDPATGVELRHFYNLTLASGGNTLSQLDGPVELWFEVIDGIDAADSFISRVTENADEKLSPTIYTDNDGVTWIKVLTDHFSPYALTDLLSAEEKASLAPPDNNQSDETPSDETPKHNVQTGDHAAQLAVAGLDMMLVLALGIMLRLITGKKKFEK